MHLRQACAAALALMLAANPVFAQTLVGQTDKVVNSVVGKLQDRQRALVKADSVYLNEALDTGGQSATEVSFRDSTKLTVGPNSSVVLDAFVFDPNPARGRMALSMTKGAMRFTSGTMASQVYSVRTPTALIGVRGTIFTVVVAADGLTTLTVEQGVATISNLAGAAQSVSVGQASSVAAGAPPTPPGPPPPAAVNAVGQMDTVIAQAPGGPAGTAASAQGVGGLGVVGGAVGLAALIGLAVALSSDDDDDAATATATGTTPGTN